MLELRRLLQVIRRYVVDQRVFAKVVADHGRDIRIDTLVVGDPRSRSVGDGDVASPPRVNDCRRAQPRIRAKARWTEPLRVDSRVDDVDPRQLPAWRATPHLVLVDDEGPPGGDRRAAVV